MENEKNDIAEHDEHGNCRRVLEALALDILPTRDEAIQFRANSGIERIWREDEKMFDGLDFEASAGDMIDYATGQAYRHKDTQVRSRVVVNIIRGRCETAEGRFADILLPTDDKNWGLKPTPKPELEDQGKDFTPAMQNGQPIKIQGTGKRATMADVAKDIKRRAEEAMGKMEAVIEDQLNESGYNGEVRKVIQNAVRMGTGVLKGPNVVNRVSFHWVPNSDGETTVHELEVHEEKAPESVSVNPWNVYPSPSTRSNVQRTCEYIWERDEILERDVKKLIGVDGYFKDQVRLALLDGPGQSRKGDAGKRRIGVNTREGVVKSTYEQWEYYGDVKREYLEGLGLDCPREQAISAVLVFINDRVVKADLNPLDTGQVGYDFFAWSNVSSDMPWGIGIPRQLFWLQRIIIGAFRAMMDNAGDSSGSMTVMLQGLQPADGVWKVGGKSLYIATEDIEDARQAMQQFQTTNNQPELQNIVELALRFVDLETSMPTIFQGEAQEVPETLGATNIMVDSSNIGLRQRVKLFDDNVTRPHLERYYHWNMQYNHDPAIKGDFQVDPRGTSVLLERDTQGNNLLQVFSLKGDPDVDKVTDWGKAAELLFKARRLPILKSKEEQDKQEQQQQQAQPPEDPSVVAAKIRSDAMVETEKLKQESDMKELEFKAAEAEKDRIHRKEMKEYDYQIKMMEYAEKRNISLDKIKAQLAISAKSLNIQQKLSGESSPQVATPPTEPEGRAENGHAYEQ